ncbi:MAG: hypothetical protein KAG61_06595 [Bacteriovoracaceae bacterium]|nr:hypothetical protein [Bacteriovoracaceae bacterium]
MKILVQFIIILVGILVSSGRVFSYERADSFVVRAYSNHYKVLAPATLSKNLSVIIENKMLANLVGRLETEEGRVLTFVRVDAGKYKSITIKGHKKEDKILFFPLSPAFQKIELKLGVRPYEIPPKR